jgi:nucleotide-binding universal stress UspA family protein
MEYRTIVVHLDRSPASPRRLEVAMHVAQRCGAHLEAVFAVADPNLPGMGSRHRLAFVAPEAADFEQQFHELTAEAGIPSSWQALVSTTDVGVTQDVILRARFADLVVAGQYEAATADGSVPADLVDQVIVRSGTPVLVVPFAGRFDVVGERVLIAWNASREATRVVRDALPLLSLAREVTVLALAAAGGDSRFGEPGVEHLVALLHRHGIEAQAERLIFDPGAINAADRLLSHLADAGADLLVIGGPGQVGGGAQAKRSLTRKILASMTVPIIVSY